MAIDEAQPRGLSPAGAVPGLMRMRGRQTPSATMAASRRCAAGFRPSGVVNVPRAGNCPAQMGPNGPSDAAGEGPR